MRSLIQSQWKKISTILLGSILLFYVISSYAIGRQVQGVVTNAMASHPGDATTALLSIMNSEEYAIADRNQAIWALGQLGDSQALKPLEALYTGQECNHETELCQHELDKAIQLCRGDWNVGALVWRRGDLAR